MSSWPLHSLRLHSARSPLDVRLSLLHCGSIPLSRQQSIRCQLYARLLVATGYGAVMVFVGMAINPIIYS